MNQWKHDRLRVGRENWQRTVWVSLCSLVLAAGLVALPAWADDDDKDYGTKSAERLQKLTKKLSLSVAQQEKVGQILEEKSQKMKALHEQMKAARQQAMEQIKNELTPDQKEKFENMQEKHKKKRHERHKKHGKKNDRHADDHD